MAVRNIAVMPADIGALRRGAAYGSFACAILLSCSAAVEGSSAAEKPRGAPRNDREEKALVDKDKGMCYNAFDNEISVPWRVRRMALSAEQDNQVKVLNGTAAVCVYIDPR